MAASSRQRRKRDEYTITASEIGEYAYCSRAWWYKHVIKLPPPETGQYGRMAAGTRAHRRHGRWVAASARLQAAGILLVLIGVLVLVVALWLGANP